MSRTPTPNGKSPGGGTPAVVALERAGVAFTVHEFAFEPGELGYGKAAATALGVDESRVFKTLLVETLAAAGPGHAVGIVPVSGTLSLKAMAHALGVKRAAMLDTAAAERVTGYVVGGISPIGQKKAARTIVDTSALTHSTIFVSGGKRGLDIEIDPRDLVDVLDAITADIAAP